MDNASIPTPPGALEPGSRLGKYEIVRLIGAGGMGAVYEGVHTDLQKRVAVKALHPAVTDVDVLQRFVREGQAASRIRHPNAVDVIDVGSAEGRAYLVMEFLEGENLGSRIAKGGAMTVSEIADTMLPVMAAINAAHREGIVHRDLKPDNIFLARNRDGVVQPKVVDFGISKMKDPVGGSKSAPLTGTTSVFGTPNYMSPEQLKSTKNVGPSADQYALGVILYECATAKMAFDGETVFMVFEAVVSGRFERPRELKPELPASFEAMILRAMSLTPSERFPSLSSFARQLLKFANAQTAAIWEPVFRGSDDDVDASLATEFSVDGTPAPAGSTGKLAATSARPVTQAGVEVPARAVTASPDPSSRNYAWIGAGAALVLAVIGGLVWTAMGGSHSAEHSSVPPTSAAAPTPAPAGPVPTVVAGSPSTPPVAAPVPVAAPGAPSVAAPAPAPATALAAPTQSPNPPAANQANSPRPAGAATRPRRGDAHHGGTAPATGTVSTDGTNAMPYSRLPRRSVPGTAGGSDASASNVRALKLPAGG